MLKLFNVTCLTIYCSFIYYLSSKPSISTPSYFEHQDKVFHMGVYFIMAILAWRFVNDYFSKPVVVLFISLIFCSIYGITDEWHQSYVPGREADFLDWVADTFGALIGSSIAYFRHIKMVKN